MKKYYILLAFIFLPFCSYHIYQKYTWHKNEKYFFKNTEYSLFSGSDSLFAYEFLEKLSFPSAAMDSVKYHICVLKKEILSKNEQNKPFSQTLLKNELDSRCPDLTLYTPDNQPVYIKNTYLCNTHKECKTILLQLDNYLISDSREVWHIQNNRLIPQEYNLFFKNVLNINNPDDIVLLGFNQTGIGNNLFQYWGAYIYALKHKKTLIPIVQRPILDIFKNMSQVPKEFSSIKKSYYFFNVQERKINFETQQLLFNQNPISYQNLVGYDEYIRENTQFSQPLSPHNKRIATQMKKENSVAVHIRRTDFETAGIHILKMSYYEKAIKYMNDKLTTPHFYVFSDDINWCKENLKIPYPHTFVDWNKKDYEDLQLMTYSNHFIIANSSFSWWGAFLGRHPDKIVVTPKKGFYQLENDMYNEDLISFSGCVGIDE